jgi:hypothetical protein
MPAWYERLTALGVVTAAVVAVAAAAMSAI